MVTESDSVNALIQSLSAEWLERLEIFDYAYQPIVDINNGLSVGFEALLREYKAAGFDTICEVFDLAAEEHVLFRLDLALRYKAISKFKTLENYERYKLFFNVDGRLWHSKDYRLEVSDEFWSIVGIKPYSLCFEISEKQILDIDDRMIELRQFFKNQGYKIVVDDCGAGFSGLQTMYYAEPDFVKIDRFFIHDVARNPKKRIFVSSIVNISHSTGAMVIAEGVETAKDYYKCREIGCDYVQGYFVARPTQNIEQLQPIYDQVRELRETDRRRYQNDDTQYINIQMTRLEPVHYDTNPYDIFTTFQRSDEYGIVPIVNSNQEPMGVITEKSFKPYAYSSYGRELLQNRALTENLTKFFRKCPIADIRTPMERILELYSQDDDIEGIIIVENMKYVGFMDANSLVKALNEKNLHTARDLNPLTKLPGNMVISEYLTNSIADQDNAYTLAYFDFDNFKPFNDYHGFRRGDRVISLFAQIMRQRQDNADCFLGHIGGDDFFMGIKGMNSEKAIEEVAWIIGKFAMEVRTFYDEDDLQRGHIVAMDRQETERRFPLMTVSAVLVQLRENRQRIISIEEVDNLLARHKKAAKAHPDKMIITQAGDD